MARVAVLNGEVRLAELGRAVAVLWEVTLVATRPTLGSSRKKLKRERRGRLHQKIETLQQRRTLHPTHDIPPKKGTDLEPCVRAVYMHGDSLSNALARIMLSSSQPLKNTSRYYV